MLLQKEKMMKKWILCLLLLVAVLLTGCAGAREPETVTMDDGTELTIDRSAGTVSDGRYTYRYALSGNTEKYTAVITYPNGAAYNETVNGGVKTDYWTGDEAEAGYLGGEMLVSSVIRQLPQPKNMKMILAGALMLVIGLLPALFPRLAWKISNSTLAKNTEPTEEDLKKGRIMGICMSAAGILVLLL